MATFDATSKLTLREIIARKDPDGDLMPITETLTKRNAFLQDMPWLPTNDATSHKTNTRNYMPGGTRRRYNQGTAPKASATDPRLNVTTTVEGFSEVDELLGEDSGDVGTLRAQEGFAFHEQFAIDAADDFIYGNEATDIDNMTGFFPRMDAIDNVRVLDNGGTGSDLMSALIVQPGPGQVYAIYPKYGMAGMNREDLGKVLTKDSNGRNIRQWTEQFTWRYGLCVEDDRCIARIANIETSGAVNIFNFEIFIDAMTQMKIGADTVIYVSRKLWAQIQKEAINKPNNFLTMANVFGDGDIPTINNVPVRLAEGLSETESAVV
jgi:hypothetical protein